MKDGIEVTRGYSKLATALNICQQQITWMCWLFIRPASSHKAGKPLGVKSSNAVSSAAGAPKKKSSKGSGRKTQGLPPQTTPPPFKPQPAKTSLPAPERPRVIFTSTDTRPQYYQEAIRQQQWYESGSTMEIPYSPPWEKQGRASPSNSGHQGDMQEHLAKNNSKHRWKHNLPLPRPSLWGATPFPKSRKEWGTKEVTSPLATTKEPTMASVVGPLSMRVLPGLHQLPIHIPMCGHQHLGPQVW